MSSINKYGFIYSFPNFVFYFFPICASSSNVIVNRSGDSIPPCLVPDHRGKMFTISPSLTVLTLDIFIDTYY